MKGLINDKGVAWCCWDTVQAVGKLTVVIKYLEYVIIAIWCTNHVVLLRTVFFMFVEVKFVLFTDISRMFFINHRL